MSLKTEETNSETNKKKCFHILVKVMGLPLRDANDSLCTTWFAIAARCGTTALAVTAQMKSSSLVLVN